MAKKDTELVEKFKEVEDKILKELKETNLSIDYESDRKNIVSSLKAYIKRIKKIEEILNEYESLSVRLEKMMGAEEKQENVTTAVVELREDSEELQNEIKSINGQIVVTKKKKKSSNNHNVKEF